MSSFKEFYPDQGKLYGVIQDILNEEHPHSLVQASSITKWLKDVKGQMLAPRFYGNQHARRGTVLHAVLTLYLSYKYLWKTFYDVVNFKTLEGDILEDLKPLVGCVFEVDNEFVQALTLEDIKDVVKIAIQLQELICFKNYTCIFEKQLDFSDKKILGGTPDLVLFNDDTLVVYDYKFGKTPVKVEANKQLMVYAVMARAAYAKVRDVKICILQPALQQLGKPLEYYDCTIQELDQLHNSLVTLEAEYTRLTE